MQTYIDTHILYLDADGYPVGHIPLPEPPSRWLRAAEVGSGLAAAGLVAACLLVQVARVAGAAATLPLLALPGLVWWLVRRAG